MIFNRMNRIVRGQWTTKAKIPSEMDVAPSYTLLLPKVPIFGPKKMALRVAKSKF